MNVKFLSALAAVVLTAGTTLAAGTFKAGFARADINPPLGSGIPGYFNHRIVSGIHDDIEANAVAFSDGSATVVAVSLDLVEIKGLSTAYRRQAAAATHLAPEAIYLACTHTHTGGNVGKDADSYEISFDGLPAYDALVGRRIAEVCRAAIADLKPAHMLQGRTVARGISFIRRFRMKDGKATTNPGVNNPDIVSPIGTPDEEVQLVRIMREGACDILLVNFSCHPDCIGGTRISSDWPGVARRALEGALAPNTRCILFNGAEGDVNHVNVHPAPDRRLAKGFAQAEHFGRALAGAVLAEYDYLAPVEAGRIRTAVREVPLPIRDRAGEDVAAAKAAMDLHRAGRAKEIKGPRFRLVEAARIERLANEPAVVKMPVSAFAIGENLCFTGLPCEPFVDYGRAAKRASPFKMTFFTCLTNGSFGYLATAEGCAGESYESVSTIFAPACEALVVDAQRALLEDLKRM